MREFKFIRGIYTNENIFNSDETEDCWLACDKNCDDVLFTAQNDEEFQERFVRLSSERLSELYTIRPSQFKAYANKTNDSSYSFHYELDDKVYDGIESFPDNVKTLIESHLRDNITATIINGLPSLILPNNPGDPTSVSFTYKNNKTDVRGLYFKVSGELTKYTLEKANGKANIAYEISNGEVNFNDKLEDRMFISGKLQQLIEPTSRTVAIDSITVNDSNYNSLGVESRYVSADGFMFVYNNALEKDVTYGEISNSVLYKYVDTYLVQVNKDKALNNGELKNNYVAYKEGCCPTECYRDNDSDTIAYEFSTKDCVQQGDAPIEDWEDYSFYEKKTGGAYVSVGSCVVTGDIGLTIVKGYEASYKDLYVISNDELTPLSAVHLTSTKIDVYSKTENYTIISGGVYVNDNDLDYVTLTGEDPEDITNENVTVTGDYVAPKQDTNIFRQIKNVYIRATESLSD